MGDYIYQVCLYDSKDCNSIWDGFFGAPDIVGYYSEEKLQDAICTVENNVTDLAVTVYDFATIDKIPLNTLYYSTHIEERYIYKYTDKNSFKLVGILKGAFSVREDTEGIVKRVLKGE